MPDGSRSPGRLWLCKPIIYNDIMLRKISNHIYVVLAACLLMACQLPGHSNKAQDLPEVTADTAAIDGNDAVSAESDADSATGDAAEGSVADADGKSSPANPVCGLPRVAKGTPEVVLRRVGYTVSFNPDNRIPNWVAWELTADHTDGPYKRGGIKFQEDEGVTTYDYQRSGYDRGHMCPSGDNKWSEEAQQQSFLMTNMCPQSHGLNAGDWNEMEMQCRRWADEFGSLDIIAGPILFRGRHKTIGSGVVVPEAFFKVVYCPSRHMAIGFIYRNEPGNRPKGDYVNSVAEIERITGFTFLTALPPKLAAKVKKEADLSQWY